MRLRIAAALCLFLVLGLATVPVHASDAKQQAKTVAPYLDDSAIAVARVDLTKFKPADIFKVIKTYLPITDREAAPAQGFANLIVTALRQQKVDQAFMIFSLDDIPNGKPLVVVPVGDGGDPKTVAAILFSGNPGGPTKREKTAPAGRLFDECRPVGNVVLCGSFKRLAALKSLKPSPRPYLEDALRSVNGAMLQFVIVPSEDHRRVIAEMMPTLPEDFGNTTGRDVAKAIRWQALGIAAPPALKATWIVQADDAAGAKTAKALLEATVKSVAKLPPVRQQIPQLEKLVELLSPTVTGSRLTLTLDVNSKAGKQLIDAFQSMVTQARDKARRQTSMNNLKQLALAMHNFHETYRSFPPVASFDKKNKKLLSWRVYLLPFLDQQRLFEQFRLDEPWDSEHNRKLIARMPPVFADPTGRLKKPGMTRYLAPVGANHLFDGKPEGVPIKAITDGTSNTIMIVEAAPESAVVWTKPDDIDVDSKNPFKGLLSKDAKGFFATFADGSVRFVPKTEKPDILKAYFTRNGGEVTD